MDIIKLRARAKINLSIDILGIFDDGYHNVEMIMQSIDLSDYVVIRKKDEGFKMYTSSSDLPVDKRNIIFKTWEYMKNKYDIVGGIEVFLEKNIPIAAGMAGGSADSAAMFIGLNELFGLNISRDQLIEDSKELGSDIAFCINGGTYLATGKGTDLKQIDNLDENLEILICKPNTFVSTKRVYKKFDSMYGDMRVDKRPNNKGIMSALKTKDVQKMTNSMYNVLEPVTKIWCRNIASIEKIMLDKGALISMMSGSGPTVFGIFEDGKNIKKCSDILRKKYSQTFITKASNKGVEICGIK